MSTSKPLPTLKWKPLRRLLQLDAPIPERSEAEFKVEKRRNYRWNFLVNLLDVVAFNLGLNVAAPGTIMPLFISKLTDNPLPIGLLSMIAKGGWFLPQLFTANFTEQVPRKKAIVGNLGLVLERLPFFVIAFSVLLAPRAPTLTILLFLFGYMWHTLGAGVVAAAWQDLMGRIFPVRQRGRFFGISSAIGAVVGALGAALSGIILNQAAFPHNFFYIFLIGALGIGLSWVFLMLTTEPVRAIPTSSKAAAPIFEKIPEVLKTDPNFTRYLIARSLLALGFMGSNFLTVAAIQRWAVPDSVVGTYTLLQLVGQAVGNLIFGFLADRLGHKRNLVIGGALGALTSLLAWLAPTSGWFFGVFVLQGLAFGSLFVSSLMITLEFAPLSRRPTYIGLANTTVGVVGILASAIATGLASIDYTTMFIVAMIMSVFSLSLMQWGVREPRSLHIDNVDES
jgi:MFS family permease